MAGHEPEKGEVNVQTSTERLHNDMREENEKDCTDKLLECTTECAPTDTECKAECVEEYKECDLPWEKECHAMMVEDEMPMENVPSIEYDEGEIISEILTLTALLDGKCTRSDTLTSTGRSSKLITIEYDIKERDKGSSQET